MAPTPASPRYEVCVMALDRFPVIGVEGRSRVPGPTRLDRGKRTLMNQAHFQVTLETRDGRRVLSAPLEREVALMAESVMRRYEGETLTVAFSIDCADREAGRRIAFYLTDLALELT